MKDIALKQKLTKLSDFVVNKLLKEPNFIIQVALGKVEGIEVISKNGENSDIDIASAPEDIWAFGGIRGDSIIADIDTISSDNVNDTQEVVITGLDENWKEVIQAKTLDGQNKVSLDTPLIRSCYAYNNNSDDLEGSIYVYVDTPISSGVPIDNSKVRNFIKIGSNETETICFTIPAGKTALYLEGFTSISRGNVGSANMTLKVRLFEKVYRVKRRISINNSGSGSWKSSYSVPIILPEKTDIKIVCESVTSDNAGVSGGFQALLFDNVIWNL